MLFSQQLHCYFEGGWGSMDSVFSAQCFWTKFHRGGKAMR